MVLRGRGRRRGWGWGSDDGIYCVLILEILPKASVSIGIIKLLSCERPSRRFNLVSCPALAGRRFHNEAAFYEQVKERRVPSAATYEEDLVRLFCSAHETAALLTRWPAGRAGQKVADNRLGWLPGGAV